MAKTIDIGSASIQLDDYTIGGTAILGTKGSGKTYAAKGIAEQLLDYDIPIIVFDAIGVWRWLRTSGDGKAARGFKVVVAGGESGDLPLTPGGATEIVRAAIRENISLVIDLYSPQLSKADWRKIVQTCFHVLLYENVGVRHIFLEECAEYCPQRVFDGETYAAVEKLVRMGGNKSLGITLINQRAQEVNKAVLDLCENMILLRQRGSHAIDSLEKWMDRLSPAQAKQIATSMPNMKQGDCWVFPGDKEDAALTRSTTIKSFHPDRKKPENAKGRAVADTGDFIVKMKADLTKFLEEQNKNDPVKIKLELERLKRKLSEQERSLQADTVMIASSNIQLQEAERRGYQIGHNEAVAAAVKLLEKTIVNRGIQESIDCLNGLFGTEIPYVIKQLENSKIAVGLSAATVPSAPVTQQAPAKKATGYDGSAIVVVGPFDLTKCERAILCTLNSCSSMSKARLAIQTLYVAKSGNFANSLGRLRSQGFIEGNSEALRLLKFPSELPEFTPILSTGELVTAWQNNGLTKCEREILGILLVKGELLKNELAERTGYVAKSGNFANSLGHLRSLNLISRGSKIRLSEYMA